MKRLILAIFIAFLFPLSAHAEGCGEVRCYLHGRFLAEGSTIIVDDVGYVAASAVRRTYDLAIETEDDHIVLRSDRAIFRLPFDGDRRGDLSQKEKPPMLITEGKVYLPIRYIAENLGDTVAWEESRRIIAVEKDGEGDVFRVLEKTDRSRRSERRTMDTSK